MALYSYRAMDASGRIVQGRLDAGNLADLEARLKRLNFDFINGRPLTELRLPRRTRVSRRELIKFCFHLEQLAQAGVPLFEGLTDLQDSLPHGRFRDIVASMIESIQGGRTLSQAMAMHPRAFDDIFTSLIRTGEITGHLPEVLGNLAASLKWQDELAAHIRKLLMYPALLGTVVLAVFLFMMIYLVPRMAGFIQAMGQQMPMQTRILIALSDVVSNYGHLAGATLLALLALLAAVLHYDPQARHRLDACKLRLPLLGNILRKIILARFASVFAMMYASGIAILDAIRITEGIVGNAVIREGLAQAGRMIADGQNVTTAFQNADLFPPLVIRMLRVGENTGQLDKALANVGYFYDRDVRESIERVQAMIEPLMTLIIGILLGWVMLAVLGPIYDSISKVRM